MTFSNYVFMKTVSSNYVKNFTERYIIFSVKDLARKCMLVTIALTNKANVACCKNKTKTILHGRMRPFDILVKFPIEFDGLS